MSGGDERRQLIQQRIFAFRLCNAVRDNRIRLRHKAVVDFLASVEVVVHGRPTQAGARRDGLKIGGLIATFGDHFARRAKNARPCLGRVGTDRATPSPAARYRLRV